MEPHTSFVQDVVLRNSAAIHAGGNTCHCNAFVSICVRLVDVNTRHRAETEMETERLRSAQIQAEKLLEARERAHRQKVKGLEEQVCFVFVCLFACLLVLFVCVLGCLCCLCV